MSISYPLAMPTTPSFKRLVMRAGNVVGVSESPFTKNQQVYEWPGDWWEASVTLPPMPRATAEAWNAWLLALRGRTGTFLLGDPAGATPRGAGGTAVTNVASQTGKALALANMTPSTLILRAGDYLHVGVGASATRIRTSGGSITLKYVYTAVTPSFNGSSYTSMIRIVNVGTKAVTVVDNLGGTQTVAAGATATVTITSTGNGVNSYQMAFLAPLAADSLDFIAWDPRMQLTVIDSNLIPTANRDFTGWTAGTGATVTLTQSYNQRLYKALSDMTSDSSGTGVVDVFPSLRADAMANADTVTFSSAKGLFRLKSNIREFDINEARVYGVSFEAVEAI